MTFIRWMTARRSSSVELPCKWKDDWRKPEYCLLLLLQTCIETHLHTIMNHTCAFCASESMWFCRYETTKSYYMDPYAVESVYTESIIMNGHWNNPARFILTAFTGKSCIVDALKCGNCVWSSVAFLAQVASSHRLEFSTLQRVLFCPWVQVTHVICAVRN